MLPIIGVIVGAILSFILGAVVAACLIPFLAAMIPFAKIFVTLFSKERCGEFIKNMVFLCVFIAIQSALPFGNPTWNKFSFLIGLAICLLGNKEKIFDRQ